MATVAVKDNVKRGKGVGGQSAGTATGRLLIGEAMKNREMIIVLAAATIMALISLSAFAL